MSAEDALVWPVVCSANQLMVARLQARGYVANVPFLLRASGKLSLDVLADALQTVVDRHEILRSPFAKFGKTVVQLAPQPWHLDIKFHDLTHERKPLFAAHAECAAACRAPFPLDGVGRLNIRVSRLGENDHLIAGVIDHLAADGMSLGILGSQWRASYQSIDGGMPLEIPSFPPQYRTFSEWQRSWLLGEQAEALRGWWAERLRGFDDTSSTLTADGVRPAASIDFSLSNDVGRRVAVLCTRHKLTPFMVVLGAYALMIAALEKQNDILIATVRANRRDPTTAGMIGNLANLVPIRLVVRENSTVRDFLLATRDFCRETYQHDVLPFLEIADVASRRLGLAPASLARYAINFIPFPDTPEVWSPDLRIGQQWGLLDPRPLSTGIASLFVRQQGTRFGGTLIAAPAGLPKGWMDLFATRLAAIIVGLAQSPRRAVREIVSAARLD